MKNKKITIGYFNQILRDEWAILPWRGVVKAAVRHNVNLLSFHGCSILESNGYDKQENIIYDLAKGGKLDGLIAWKGHLTKNLNDDETKRFYSQYGVPVVTIEGDLKGFPCVTYGNYEGMKLMVNHLITQHRFKKIGYVGLVENHTGFQERYRGYKYAMRENGIDIMTDFVTPLCPWDGSIKGMSVDEILKEWLKSALNKGIEAIIGSCDPVSKWIIIILEKMGKIVPYDVAVTGFDGFNLSRIITPSLTTINPSWIELGSLAMDTIIDIINHKSVCDKTIVNPKIVIAQTCGCMEESIVLAEGNKSLRTFKNETFKELDIGNKENVLVDTFMKDIKGIKKNTFLKLIDFYLRESIHNKKSLNKWQDIITVLKEIIDGKIMMPGVRKKADILINKARILISITASRNQENDKENEIEIINNEREFGLRLISNFNLNKIFELIAGELPGLGIAECYISIFDNPKSYIYPDPAPEWSRLVMAYDKNGMIKLDPDGLRFPSMQIIPDHLWKDDDLKNYSVNSLYFQENQIGFAVFDAGLSSGTIYSILTSQISSALQGTLLINKINLHTEILERGIGSISKSIGEMTDNIESITDNIFRQSKAVEQSASSIEEMKSNIGNITGISDNAADISRNLNAIAVESINSIKILINSIKDIQSKSTNILELLKLIQDISDKTKLLAFNASVEAAHAGATGKGFNIVSKEIRKLSEDTDASLRKIGIETSILINKINESATLSNVIITNLDMIIDNSRKNSDISNQLSMAMQEQNKGSGEVLRATIELVKITSEIKTSMSEQVHTTSDFKKALKELSDNIK